VQQLEDAHAKQGPVEGRHPLDGPVLGVAGDESVELAHVQADAHHHLDCECVRLDRQRGQDRGGSDVLALGLVQQ